jgi:predicted peptidase
VIFVAPTAVLGHWASEAELELIEALIEGMIEADWPIDPSRIVLSGFSAGGTGTWYMTGTNPALFRAGISIAAEPLAGSLEGTRLVPKYVIHSRADLEFLFDDVQIEVQAEIDAGAPIVFALVDDLSHNAFYAYLPALESARLWLSEILN